MTFERTFRPLRALRIAALGLLAIVSASACAQSANLTVYGRINLDAEVVSGAQADGTNPRVARVSSNSSAVGFRGSEYLGNSLVALFQVESEIQADVGGSTWATRETYLGLDAPWGTVKLGYFLGPYDDIHPIFGNVPTFTTSILSTASLWAQGYAAKNIGGFDARLANSVRYDSPDFSGLTGSVQLSLGEGTTYPGSPHAYVLSSGLFYSNGRLQLGLGYEHNHGARNNPVEGGNILDDSAYSLAGAWDFGPVRIGAIYEYLDYDTPSPTGGTYSLTRNFFGVSGTIPAGPGVIYAFYGRAGDGRGTAPEGTRVAGFAKGADSAAAQWEISYTYAFSKRTFAYGGYVRIDNGQNAAYTFNNNPYVTAIGGKPTGLVLGMVHFF